MPRHLDQIISTDRIQPYLIEAGFSHSRAYDLYIWNMKVGAAFMPLLSCSEIALRNLVSRRLAGVYGANWWQHPNFLLLLQTRGKGIVKRAEGDIMRRKYPVTAGRMTAELSFGFWHNMLLPKYAAVLWTPFHPCFPAIPSAVDQNRLHKTCGQAVDLRNRISHHEPLFKRNLSQDYGDSLKLLTWLSPDLAAWIKPHCEVPRLLRAKP